MEFRHLLPLSALFCLALLGSHAQASLPAEDYWQSLWPNTPMPKALRDLLQPGKWNRRTRGRAHAKQQVPNGVFVFEHDAQPGKPNAVAKTFPFYLYGKESDIPGSKNTVEKTFPFYLYGKESDLQRSKNAVEKTFPFYLYGKEKDTVEKTFPFYLYDKESEVEKTFPFYLYGKEKDPAEKTFPFFLYGKEREVEKTFPFYLYGKEKDTAEKTFPFFLYGKEREVEKTFPFYLYGKEKGTVEKTFPFLAYGKENDLTGSKSTVEKTFPFYLYGKENDLTRSKSTIEKTFPFYFYGKESDLKNTVEKQFPFYFYGKESDLKNTVEKQFPFYVYGKESDIKNTVEKQFPFYVYGKESDLTRSKHTVPNGTFFFEHDLLPGKKLILEPTKPSDEFTFLPDTVAKTMPFSSNRLPEILKHFNIEADSTDAESMGKTLAICESPAMNGEEKYCATSFESLLKFAVSKLGKNTRLLSTEFERETQDRHYSIVEGVKKNGEKAVVCHKMDYPYAVFYCHKIDTRSYTVPLVATGDGTRAKALAVCHTDTTHWHPEHIAFKQLNAKPGTTPICHFLATDTVLWVPNLALNKRSAVMVS